MNRRDINLGEHATGKDRRFADAVALGEFAIGGQRLAQALHLTQLLELLRRQA